MWTNPDDAGGRRIGRLSGQLVHQHASLCPMRGDQSLHSVTGGRQPTARSRYNAKVSRLVTLVRVPVRPSKRQKKR